MKALITGANGHIASYLIEYLLELGRRALQYSEDSSGKSLVIKAAEEVKNEPLGRKAELNLPFAIGNLSFKKSSAFLSAYTFIEMLRNTSFYILCYFSG